MIRKLLGLFFGLCLSMQAIADNYVDVVQNVSLNSLNPAQLLTYDQLVKAFGTPKSTKVSALGECVSSISVTARYAEKTVYLEYLESDNPKALFGKPFEYQNPRLKGKLSVKWQNMASLNERLMLDGWQVRSDLTFDEFKKRFPLSAKTPEETGSHGELKYAVVFGLNMKKIPNKINQDEVYLSRHILFTFKNKKLIQLRINQGDDC